MLQFFDRGDDIRFALARRAVGEEMKDVAAHPRRRIGDERENSIPYAWLVAFYVAGAERLEGLRTDRGVGTFSAEE